MSIFGRILKGGVGFVTGGPGGAIQGFANPAAPEKKGFLGGLFSGKGKGLSKSEKKYGAGSSGYEAKFRDRGFTDEFYKKLATYRQGVPPPRGDYDPYFMFVLQKYMEQTGTPISKGDMGGGGGKGVSHGLASKQFQDVIANKENTIEKLKAQRERRSQMREEAKERRKAARIRKRKERIQKKNEKRKDRTRRSGAGSKPGQMGGIGSNGIIVIAVLGLLALFAFPKR